MEFTPSDRLAAQIHFARARESLRALVAFLRPFASGVTSDAVRAAITTAVDALDVAAHELDPDALATARVACPSCGDPVTFAARSCGSCGHKLG